MNKRNKDHEIEEPLHIQLGDDEDQHGGGEVHDTEVYEDGEVEVIRPHVLKSDNIYTRGRGLHSQPVAEEEEQLPPSKTRIKRPMHELRDLGKELTELGKDQLEQLDIPESLREAIREMKGISKFGAQRRQIQYIGKLMREVDPVPILAKLDAWKGKSQQHTAYMHLLERWRDRLMGDDSALTELLATHPDADVQRLRALIRNAHKELASSKPPRNYREIFQVLRAIIPET